MPVLSVLSLALLLLAAPGSLALAPNSTLTICVIPGAPSVTVLAGHTLKDGDIISSSQLTSVMEGFAVDTIQSVFGEILEYPYQVVFKSGFSRILYQTRRKECDVFVQDLFVSARRDSCDSNCADPADTPGLVGSFTSDADYEAYTCCLDFSYAFYDGGWSLMAKVPSGAGQTDYISVFFQQDVVHAICVCVILVFFVAHVFWLVERMNFGQGDLMEEKEYFGVKYLDGLRDSVWFSSLCLLNGIVVSGKLVTLPWTRVLGTVWVMFGLIMNCFITAIISSTLTTNRVSGSLYTAAADIAGRKLCIPSGFYDYYFTKTFPGIGVKKVYVEEISQCYSLLQNGQADAVFGVREEFVAMFQMYGAKDMYISPVISKQAYALAFANRFALESDINSAILSWKEASASTSILYSKSVQKWYSGASTGITYSDANAADAGQSTWNWGLIGAAIALAAVYMLLQAFVMVGSHFARQEAAVQEDLAKIKRQPSTTKKLMAAASRKLSSRVDGADSDAGDLSGAPSFKRNGSSSVAGGDANASNGTTSFRNSSVSLGRASMGGGVNGTAASVDLMNLKKEIDNMQRLICQMHPTSSGAYSAADIMATVNPYKPKAPAAPAPAPLSMSTSLPMSTSASLPVPASPAVPTASISHMPTPAPPPGGPGGSGSPRSPSRIAARTPEPGDATLRLDDV